MDKGTAKVIVQVLAVLSGIGGVFAILGGIFMAIGGTAFTAMMPMQDMPAGAGGVMGAVFIIAAIFILIFGALYLLIAWGLWTFKNWARIAAIVLSVIGLLGFPIGTVISAIVIYLLAFNKDVVKQFK